MAQGDQEVDREWADHQAGERARRTPPLVRPVQPRRPQFDILAVVASVEADFRRWRREREQGDT